MIYFIILIILSGGATAALLEGDSEITAFCFSALCVTWLVCGVGAHLSHVGDLSIVETQEQVVDIQSDKVQRMRTALGTLKISGGALLNADTPMAGLIGEIALAEKDLAEAKITLVKAKRRIIARQKSVFKFVT